LGLLDTIAIGIIGTVILNKDNKRMEKRNKKRQAWLKANNYDIEKQLEIERWCRENIETAIEQAYGYPYRSLPWERVYGRYKSGNTAVQAEIYKLICNKNGIEFFDFRFPPKAYKNIE